MLLRRTVDPAAAKYAVDLRWPGADLDRESISDVDYVGSHLELRAAGVTHDERLVELYELHAAVSGG